MQGDGNFVLYAPGNVPDWASGANKSGTVAVMQGDGNFVLYAPGNVPVWASKQDMVWPAECRLTSKFGTHWGRLHAGIDIAAPIGTPIQAAQSGTVIRFGWMSGYGQTIDIDHGGGPVTRYAHQFQRLAWFGQRVNQGDLVGRIGSTGNSTGPHLHFEVHENGIPRDPLQYLP